MPNDNKQPPDKKFSLEQEMKKRKTQEILRSVESKRGQTGPLTPPATDAKRQTGPLNPPGGQARRTQTGPLTPPAASNPARMSQPMKAASPTSDARRATLSIPSLNRGPLTVAQKRILIGGIAGLLLAALCAITGILLSNNTPEAAAGLPETPGMTASKVIEHFIDLGVPISDVQAVQTERELKVFNYARQRLEFRVTRGADTGRFYLLGFGSQTTANFTAFNLRADPTYKTWTRLQGGNILLLISPATADSLKSELSSHFTQFLLAPYIPFLPTATPAPKP